MASSVICGWPSRYKCVSSGHDLAIHRTASSVTSTQRERSSSLSRRSLPSPRSPSRQKCSSAWLVTLAHPARLSRSSVCPASSPSSPSAFTVTAASQSSSTSVLSSALHAFTIHESVNSVRCALPVSSKCSMRAQPPCFLKPHATSTSATLRMPASVTPEHPRAHAAQPPAAENTLPRPASVSLGKRETPTSTSTPPSRSPNDATARSESSTQPETSIEVMARQSCARPITP